MTGALIILLVTIFVGLLLYVYDLKWRRTHPADNNADAADEQSDAIGTTAADDSHAHNGGICCGRHLVCEKSLSPMPGDKPEYFDDEELDRFAGRQSDAYTPEETEEFREVLMTLLPQDVAPWARSLQLRGIELPIPVRDELFMMLEDSPD